MARVNYPKKKKQEIVQFILDYDAQNKRGGVAQAQRKYKVAFPTLKTWLKNIDVSKPAEKTEKAAPRKASNSKASSQKAAKSVAPVKHEMSGEIMSRLEKVLDYERQIGELRELVAKEKATIRNLLS